MRFVNDEVFIQERATSHEVHALDFDAAANQLTRGGTAPLTRTGVGFAQNFQVVIQRAHPRAHFFFFRAGQKTNVFTHADRGSGHNDFGVTAVI